MNLVRWSFQNLHMPMIANEKGELFCTSKMLCRALSIQSNALRLLYKRHKGEFETLSVTESNAKDFLLANRVELGIERVRDDMVLWSENDMILVAVLSHSETSKEFRRHLVDFIKKNATRGYVTEAKHNQLLDRVGALEELILKAQPILNELASNAGASLNAQKKIRNLQLVK